MPLGNMPVQPEQPPGYRGRYDAPGFDEIPPGVEPPVPGFEPSPFEKPAFGPSGPIDRDRLPPPNYRDPYRPPPYGEGPNSYRDLPIQPPGQNEIPVHVGEQPPRYRDNYRPTHYRDQGPMTFREGQPYREPGPPGPYRDPNFRGGPPPFRDNTYRNVPYRDGGFRENIPHNSFRDPGIPFRPPSADPRETVPPNYHDPNYRENYRDESAPPRDHSRPGYRGNVRNRGGQRRNANVEHDRHRDREGREGRERERYNDNREPVDKAERSSDRRTGYEKTRENRDDRPRDYDRTRDYEKEREHDKTTPDKKVRSSPKRSRETREKKRSESRGRSRDRESRREKKEERAREKSSADRSKDHKEKEKKLKERKKKKREKEKDTDKKKKREKKDKKDKDHVKKEDDDPEKEEVDKNEEKGTDLKEDTEKQPVVKTESANINPEVVIKKEKSPKVESSEKPADDLYGEETSGAVDKEIIEAYVKSEEKDVTADPNCTENMNSSKEEPFDGIELQANADELDLKTEIEVSNPTSKEMLATLPELSKWEVDDENVEKSKEPGEITSPEEEDGSKVTSDVIKRAENAIFAKAINSLRPIEIKKISSDRLKLYGDEVPKPSMNNIQITVPVIDSEPRSIEINERKKRYSKTPPPRLSVKDRLGGKVEEARRAREPRVVQSTVERVKSRSKTPKREQPYRRVTVERERSRKQDTTRPEPNKAERRVMSEAVKTGEKHRARSPNEKKYSEKHNKEDKKSTNVENNTSRERVSEKNPPGDSKNTHPDRERKKSTLDEAHFEPDYDEAVESDHENKEENIKKRERSLSPSGLNETKKPKLDSDSIKLDLTNVKKKPDSESESTSDSEYSSSSSSSDARKRKKKKKRSKKKKKRAASDSDSESESSSDDHKKKKKKRKHKKKSSKKKKKSKHK